MPLKEANLIEIMWNNMLYVNHRITIKKRIDNKWVVIQKHKEPLVIEHEGVRLLEMFNGGNSLAKILPNYTYEQVKHKKVLGIVDAAYRMGLLTEVPTYRKEIESSWTLDEVFFELTKRCNLHCKHCYIPDDVEKDELSLKQWKALVDQCVQLGVYLIKLTGGEAMTAPFFFELASYINDQGINMRLYTNGSMLNASTISQLLSVGIKELQISVDGASAEIHDSFRGTKGNFEHIMKILPLLDDGNYNVILSFTVSEYNRHEVEAFIQIAKQYRYVKVIISPYINYHQTFHNKDMLQVSSDIIEELKVCFNKNQLLWSDKTKYFMTYSNQYIGYCGFGIYTCYIDSTGKVMLCPLMNQEENIVGNVKHHTLSAIWKHAPMIEKYRQYTLIDIESCSTCKNSNSCRGGCRARAYFENGSLLSKDSVSCSMFE